MDKLQKFIEALLKIGKLEIKLEFSNIKLLEINYNSNNHSPKITADKSGKIDINLKKITPEEDKFLATFDNYLIHEHRDKALGVKRDADAKMLDFKETERINASGGQLPSVYFSEILPDRDITMIRAAQFLETKWAAHSPDAAKYKAEIAEKFGDRGRKICNLISAGYFKDLIIPMHKAVLDSGGSDADFVELFDKLVRGVPFAVFVSRMMSEAAIKTEIETKALRYLKYGAKVLTVHGIGADNVARIRKVLEKIELPEHKIEIVSDEYTKGVLRIKLSFVKL